jgi:hypothetical protein
VELLPESVLTDRLTLESEVVVGVVGGSVLIIDVVEDEVKDGGLEVELGGVAVTVTVVTIVTVEYGQYGTLRDGLPTRVCLGG